MVVSIATPEQQRRLDTILDAREPSERISLLFAAIQCPQMVTAVPGGADANVPDEMILSVFQLMIETTGVRPALDGQPLDPESLADDTRALGELFSRYVAEIATTFTV